MIRYNKLKLRVLSLFESTGGIRPFRLRDKSGLDQGFEPQRKKEI
jgi:hypothetical protein